MAGGLAIERADQYRGKLTANVVIAAIVVSLGALIFGYVGIFGQVTANDIFYDVFYYDVINKSPRDFDYCKYSGRFGFPLYVAPIYLAGALLSILAYPFARKRGRRMSLIIIAVILLVGGAAWIFPIAGISVHSLCIGSGIQVILLYLSEIAPARARGAVIGMFQLAVSLGILLGMMKNSLRNESYETWVYFFAMAFPAIAALFMIIGAAKIIPETPSSLVERGSEEQARRVLEKMRGTDEVDAEFQDIAEASEFARASARGFYIFGDLKNMFQRRNRPQLAIAVLMPMFQNLTGVVFVFAYAPLMFWSMGYRDNANLYSVAINGSALGVSSLVSMATVDKLGRKTLLISGGVVMVLCQVIIAVMLGSNLFSEKLSIDGISTVVTVFIAIFVLAFGWSWGPLGWTIPSEIFTLETRPVGIAIAVSVNLLSTYIVLQFFIPLLCAFKYGLFLFFGGWIVVMTIFVIFFLPETKGVPVEEMGFLWPKHWFWKRFASEDSHQLNIPKQVV